MKLEMIAKSRALKVSRPWLQKQLTATLRRLPKRDQLRVARLATLTVVFVGAAEGRKLNQGFRKKNYATDVLSFAAVEPDSLGELVFCVPVIKAQAREHELSTRDELLYMLIHGVLHLLGYDHEKSDKEGRLMYRLQDRIFEELRQS